MNFVLKKGMCVINQAWGQDGLLLAKFVIASQSVKTKNRTRPIFSHLDQTSLVNKGFSIIMTKTWTFSGGTNAGNHEQARSCLGKPIRTQDSFHLIQPYDREKYFITSWQRSTLRTASLYLCLDEKGKINCKKVRVFFPYRLRFLQKCTVFAVSLMHQSIPPAPSPFANLRAIPEHLTRTRFPIRI